MRLVGPEVAELLPEPTLAQQWDLAAHEVAHNAHVDPMPGEAAKEAAHGLSGHITDLRRVSSPPSNFSAQCRVDPSGGRGEGQG